MVGFAFAGGCQTARPPYAPDEALETFQLEGGFQIELFASEPDIADPVSMEIDETGRVYVVENSGYPLNTEDNVGNVKLLEDTDGDGQPDRSTVFVDGLTMPTGVMAWKKGILVTDAPNVWYFKDEDGDGRADVREIMLAGFPFNNPQHTVSSPYFGLDNWIYLAHEGYSRSTVFGEKFNNPGREIHFPDRENSTRLPIERRSLRFRPGTGEIEYLANPSQFGVTFDRWGHLFVHNNSSHVRHEVVASRYLSRNPHLRIPQSWENMSDHGSPAQVFPITVRPRFEILSNVGHFTSASGLTLYLGGSFPSGFESTSFVAEPVHNLVHRDVWAARGATFTARRAHERREFLASKDRWFRPVNFYVGPDGSLYVLDYYREVIEHPEWTSAATYESEELYDGSDHGRIYRIVPEGGLPPSEHFQGDEQSNRKLAQTLSHPNIWWRRTAQRLLLDRNDVGAVAELTTVTKERPSAEGRLHALWTLHGLGRLDPALISLALDDPEPGVRENAVLLAESQLASAPLLRGRILGLANDLSPRVRFQVMATLGEVDSPAVRRVRDLRLFEDLEDPWMQVAALSWKSVEPVQLFRQAMALEPVTAKVSPAKVQFFERLAGMIAAKGQQADLRAVLSAVSRESREGHLWWREASLKGLAQGLSIHPGGRLEAGLQRIVLRLLESEHTLLRHSALELLTAGGINENADLDAAMAKAARRAGDPTADSRRRSGAIRMLALGAPQEQEALLKSLIVPGMPNAIQVEAVRAVGKIKGEEVGAFLLDNWRNFTSAVRAAAGEGLTPSPERLAMLIDAMEGGDISVRTLPTRVRHRLIMHQDVALRERARSVIERPAAERAEVMERYQMVLDLEGNATRGKPIFDEHCAKCHQLDGIGKEVGPDLATVRSRPAQYILGDILLPSRSIEPEYEFYVVETSDSRTLDGVLGPQTPESITLRREGGKEDIIARNQIKRMYTTELSSMPEDFDKQINVDQMADLICYIKATP